MNNVFEDRLWASDALYIKKNLWKIVLVMIIGIVLSILIVGNIPEVHRAQATYYLNKSDLNSRYFTINEYHLYNMLLLDVEKMLESNKFYKEVEVSFSENYSGTMLTYEGYLNRIYVNIDTESTFFEVGFDHENSVIAERMSAAVESAIIRNASSIIQITSVELVDSTVVLETPVGPNVNVIILTGLVAGVFLGSMLVLVGLLVTSKVNSYADVTALTNQTVLARTKIKKMRNLSAESLIGDNHRDDYQVIRQFILYDRDLHGQKIFSVLPCDESGKNESFALALAGQLGASGERTLYIPINPTDLFQDFLSASYGSKGHVIEALRGVSHYAKVVENVSASMDILIGTNRKIAFTKEKIEEFNALVASFEKDYDMIIVSVGLEEKLIFSLKEKGAFMLAVSNKSEKDKVKNNWRCLNQFKARVIGTAYQE